MQDPHDLKKTQDASTQSAVEAMTQRGTVIMQRVDHKQDDFSKWRKGIDDLLKTVERFTKLYAHPNPDIVARESLATILDAIRIGKYPIDVEYEFCYTPGVTLGIDATLFVAINNFLRDNAFLVKREGISNEQIHDLATQMRHNSATMKLDIAHTY